VPRVSSCQLKAQRMWRVFCKTCGAVFVASADLATLQGNRAVLALTCPICDAKREYTAEDFLRAKGSSSF
jgi:RNase P subunit RPR2